MKRVVATMLLVGTLAGCAISPVPAVYVPPGVVYVGPSYGAPGAGYIWSFDAMLGWGWWHPERGWHRR